MTKMKALGPIAAGLLAAASATGVNATILVDQPEGYAGSYVGGYDWGKFTQALDANGGYTVGSIGNAADVAAADAILVVERSNFVSNTTPYLTTDEIANLTGFLATGKRVVLVGDSSFFDQWTQSIIDFASGGTATVGGNINTDLTPVVSNALTAGVASVHVQGAAVVSNNGTALFNQNFATLWGDNLLTVLDLNVLQDNPGPVFRDNVAAWLGASQPTAAVPEPASWAMMIVGLGLAGATMRRSAKVRARIRFA